MHIVPTPSRVHTPLGAASARSLRGHNTPDFAGRHKRIKETKKANHWPTPPWYARLYQQKWKLLVLPLLGFATPSLDHASVHTADAAIHAPARTNPVFALHDKARDEKLYLYAAGLLLLGFVLAEAGIDLGRITRDTKAEKTARHEIAHFLLAVDGNLPVKGATASMDGGEVKLDIQAINKRLGQLEGDERNRLIRTINLMGRAGQSMERLSDGFGMMYPPFLRGDKWMIHIANGLGLKFDKTRNAVGFIHTADRRAEEWLVQFDYGLVEELARDLARDGHWGEETVNRIIERHDLRNRVHDAVREQILG